jgi:hypothetical protein
MVTITEYIDALDEPLKSVASSLTAVIEKSLPASHGSLVDGTPCWSNGDSPIAGLIAESGLVTVTVLARGDSKGYGAISEIDSEVLNLWLSAEDIR